MTALLRTSPKPWSQARERLELPSLQFRFRVWGLGFRVYIGFRESSCSGSVRDFVLGGFGFGESGVCGFRVYGPWYP